MGLCADESEKATEMLSSLLNAAGAGQAEQIYEERKREVTELLREMQEGPLREATFLRYFHNNGGSVRAHVVMEDGSSAFAVVPEEDLATTLCCGESVLLDAQARALVGRAPVFERAGEEARLERVLDAHRVEVALTDQGRYVLSTSASLAAQLETQEVGPGAMLVVCPRRRMAFDAVPPQDGPEHYLYLSRSPVPEVIASRDLGAPPAFIEELADLVRMEMIEPELRRRYRLRSCVMKLLSGVSGSGKTYSILALWRRIYEVMSEVTDVPLELLPPRVMRLRAAQVLSKWLGESDKNLDRFFEETERLAAEPLRTPDGREFRLPVLAILEEVDGLARERGEDAVYDRILTTALQRLDTTRPELRDKLIIYIATTNVAHQVDRAFLRRVGGTVECFGRLDRRSFAAVLRTHLRGLPIASVNGHSSLDGSPSGRGEMERCMVREVTDWLYSANGADRGLVEISFVGSTTPAVRYRRDFLTASVVDLAVQEASDQASKVERQGTERRGISREMLLTALDGQVRSIVDHLRPGNVGNYVDLEEGGRVASIRRREQPALQPFQLERAG
jgi:hypothetical protein